MASSRPSHCSSSSSKTSARLAASMLFSPTNVSTQKAVTPSSLTLTTSSSNVPELRSSAIQSGLKGFSCRLGACRDSSLPESHMNHNNNNNKDDRGAGVRKANRKRRRPATFSKALVLTFLRGRSQKGESQEEASGNIFKGFGVDILAEAFNVDEETAESLQSKDDTRGHIVMVERGLQVIKPPTIRKQEQEGGRGGNGFEETVCSPQIRANINNPSSADFFNPQAGWSINLNSFKLPILGMVQLSAERGVLHRNAMMSPHWMMNAHNIIYVTHGSMWMQIVNNEGESVFNDEIQEGELVVVPQNFPVVKQAKEEGCRWISFRTNDNAMINKLAGHTSALRAMPVDVIANAFQMSLEQAWSVKNNRKESVMFSPSSRLSRRSVDHA